MKKQGKFIFKKIRMKTMREKLSMTKLVFLILTLVLAFQTIRNTLHGQENELFKNVMLMIVSFYFGQKTGKSESPDALIDNEKGDE